MTPRRLLRPRKFAARLDVHVSTLYRMIAAGEIERPVRIRGEFGQRGGSVGWPLDYVNAVIEKLTSERDEHFAASDPKPAAPAKRPRGRPRKTAAEKTNAA